MNDTDKLNGDDGTRLYDLSRSFLKNYVIFIQMNAHIYAEQLKKDIGGKMEKYDLRNLTGEQWSQLLCEQPQFAEIKNRTAE